MKTCGRCKAEKPLSEFYPNRARKDGVTVYCRVCHVEYNKRFETPEKRRKMRASNNARRADYKAKGRCQCGRISREGKTVCSVCTKRQAAFRRTRIDAGLCEGCGCRCDTESIYCEICCVKRATRRATVKVRMWREVQELFTGCCAVTGVTIAIGTNAHLDHIMPKSLFPGLSGEVSNLQWVHEDVNMMKRNFTPERFLELCKNVVDFSS